MAYWQFDMTFTNLGALPAGAGAILADAIFSIPGVGELSPGAEVPATGDLYFTTSTAAPE